MQSTIKHHYNNIKKYFIKELKNKKYRKAILLINSVINLPKKYGAIYQRRAKGCNGVLLACFWTIE